jgi:DNA-directed RNA polymerase specialized sigma24 family protein
MSKIQDELIASFDATFDKLQELPDEEQILLSVGINEALLHAQHRLAQSRRTAVRSMRARGFTLQEIGGLLGMSHQRVHQIEQGYNRAEKKARGQ